MKQTKGSNSISRVLAIVRTKGAVTGRDLEAAGLSRQYLQRLYERGILERAGRRQYHEDTKDLM